MTAMVWRWHAILGGIALAMCMAATLAHAEEVVLKVNGEAVTEQEIQDMLSGVLPGQEAPDLAALPENVRDNLLRGVAAERLLYQEAVNAEVERKAEVKAKLEQAREQILIEAYLDEIADAKVGEPALKARYAKLSKEQAGRQEVRARHILVEDKGEANALYKQLTDGDGDFAALAKAHSKDAASAVRGGDLGWFGKEQMVPEFGAAAFAQKEGTISKPVKSDFGWHIIKVEGKREKTLPTFEEAKPGLTRQLVNDAVAEHTRSLLEGAKLVKVEGGKEIPLSADGPAANAKTPDTE